MQLLSQSKHQAGHPTTARACVACSQHSMPGQLLAARSVETVVEACMPDVKRSCLLLTMIRPKQPSRHVACMHACMQARAISVRGHARPAGGLHRTGGAGGTAGRLRQQRQAEPCRHAGVVQRGGWWVVGCILPLQAEEACCCITCARRACSTRWRGPTDCCAAAGSCTAKKLASACFYAYIII